MQMLQWFRGREKQSSRNARVQGTSVLQELGGLVCLTCNPCRWSMGSRSASKMSCCTCMSAELHHQGTGRSSNLLIKYCTSWRHRISGFQCCSSVLILGHLLLQLRCSASQ